ncbi:YbaB/EbfC family nucleoid-associated protein [Amycolatopsis sp. NPDC101161]|uniref:YbaB/EbfC family nucleoid-associated protein n=1 Tax=Amycolatopsis sp. NPDC101161 TaxID=3363940 RepID=UPI003812CF12
MVSTRDLIAQSRAREAAMSKVDELLASATGTAHDLDGQVEATVDGRGKLLRLWLAPSAVNLGERLGPLVVEIAQAAMREATQDGYNKVALLLGEDMTHLIERMTGMPAPARAEDDDPGMTVEEFQRLRAERLGAAPPQTAASASVEDEDAYWESFDPASLRSDR